MKPSTYAHALVTTINAGYCTILATWAHHTWEKALLATCAAFALIVGTTIVTSDILTHHRPRKTQP